MGVFKLVWTDYYCIEREPCSIILKGELIMFEWKRDVRRSAVDVGSLKPLSTIYS